MIRILGICCVYCECPLIRRRLSSVCLSQTTLVAIFADGFDSRTSAIGFGTGSVDDLWGLARRPPGNNRAVYFREQTASKCGLSGQHALLANFVRKTEASTFVFLGPLCLL